MTEAKLLITPACQYCNSMMSLLSELLKEGRIARLLIINIAEQPDEAAKHNVRSVPWLKLGEFEMAGALTRAELEHAIDMAISEDGRQRFLFDRLKNGQLDEVVTLIERDKNQLTDLVVLLKGKDVPMTVRIGVSAVLEGLQASPSVLTNILPDLLELSESSDETMRADACHFLSLEGGEAAKKRLQECIKDNSAMVRDVAEESLEEMAEL